MNIKMVKYYSNPDNGYKLLGFFLILYTIYINFTNFNIKNQKHKKL